MGIYIPNMQKPKSCAECELWSLCFYPKAPKEIDDRVMPDCPIEEEPTGILAHDIRKLIAFIEPRMIIASTYDEQIERAKAVKDWLMGIVGERGNDE